MLPSRYRCALALACWMPLAAAWGQNPTGDERMRMCVSVLSKGLEGGMMPLDYLLGIMRDVGQDARWRLDAAKAAAPYCHARLSATEVSGPAGGPVSVQATQKLDISDLDDEELDILERALQKTIALREES